MGHARYLAHDERIVLEVRRHPTVLFRPFFDAFGVLLGALILGVAFSPGDGRDIIDTVLGLLTLFFLFRFLWRSWEWWADRIVVTDRRIFEVSGLLTRKVASMPLGKMTDMTYSRSVWGRILGYGELRIESAGQDQALSRLTHLPSPDDFYRTITYLVSAGIIPKSDPEAVHEASWDEDDTGPLPRVIV
jgi:hypothetical protein